VACEGEDEGGRARDARAGTVGEWDPELEGVGLTLVAMGRDAKAAGDGG